MTKADRIYKGYIWKIIDEGCWDEAPRPRYESDDAPAHSIFITHAYEEYDISKGEFPITNLRPIGIKSGIKEILWIYQDQTSVLEVLKNKYGINWWDSWNIGDGTIGQRYGATVARYGLMEKFLRGLKSDPFGRRHVINLLQQHDLDETRGLYPCAFQIMGSVRRYKEDLYFDLSLTQRSSDYLVAGHINMIQYVALQMMIAHECGFKVGKFSRFTQNLHIYDRHLEQAKIILNRETPPDSNPELILHAEGKGFYDITLEDFELKNYNPIRPQLEFELAI